MRKDDHLSFNLVEFFRLIEKEKTELVFKHFELIGNYDPKKHLRKDIQSLANLMRISEKLTITNVSFGKKIDKVSPYNESIELP